ncbi:type I-B CRISPR-associated protein Cas7/Csh2 [Anaerobranca gottschalkii]|uniref:CRISPR-associated protein, Csh2 family n=1 Tax=Anaerobranca gottschalkii DSM 13577 TaxID=1120990 RepID=A0A1I0A900_9FIRM|nr:type I-B CRISPR-associated protein Cas7/Csh2 [Anaerobranca gottschalkii]SES90620.1 CRISPR-associated protein, Csh2 family [Anaerobranca gottschalkii DSM 13577]
MKNSEILFLYDAKLTNPNGDPDEENRPRMDYEREINLVSDLRLKRYVRDYLSEKDYPIFVSKLEGKSVRPEKIITKLKEELGKEKLTDDDLLNKFIDVRLFGATMPVEKDTRTFTGPVQFNWGQSLNKVEIFEASITSQFATTDKNEQGAIGKDYRVKYSFIGFSGVISGNRAKYTNLTEDDVLELDQALVKAIPLQATRSKIGQYPRLYLRVEYRDSETILGDYRSLVKLESKVDSPRDITEVALDITNLQGFLRENKDKIGKVRYFVHPQLVMTINGQSASITDLLGDISFEEVR